MLAGDQDLAEKGRYAREICQTIRVPLHHTASKTNPAESDAKHEPSPPTTTSLLYLMRPPAEAKQKSLLIFGSLAFFVFLFLAGYLID